jgi:hypothetical protein
MATGCDRCSKPSPKKIPETDAIFTNLHEKDRQNQEGGQTKRLSMDGKATVNIGDYSRGGKTVYSTPNWTLIPRQTGQSERSDAGLMGGTSRRLGTPTK